MDFGVPRTCPDVSKSMFFGHFGDLATSKMTPFLTPFGGTGPFPDIGRQSEGIIGPSGHDPKSAEKRVFLEDPPKCHFWSFWAKRDLPTWWPKSWAAKHDDYEPR